MGSWLSPLPHKPVPLNYDLIHFVRSAGLFARLDVDVVDCFSILLAKCSNRDVNQRPREEEREQV